MDLIEKWNILKNKNKSNLQAGYIDKIFEIHENNQKDESGFLPIIIKPTLEEKKKKRSLN